MGNFSKSLQKASLLDQMQRQLAVAELAEARSVFMVACYESLYGELPRSFLERVQAAVADTKAKTKGEFYQAVFTAAQLVDQEIAMEEADARLKGEVPPADLLELAAASLAPSHSVDPGTVPQDDAATQSPSSDSSGT